MADGSLRFVGFQRVSSTRWSSAVKTFTPLSMVLPITIEQTFWVFFCWGLQKDDICNVYVQVGNEYMLLKSVKVSSKSLTFQFLKDKQVSQPVQYDMFNYLYLFSLFSSVFGLLLRNLIILARQQNVFVTSTRFLSR